jgi:sugar lactone lactonase YvrE
MAYDNTARFGTLYRVDPGGTVEPVLDGVTIVDGPASTTQRSRTGHY